MGDREKLIVWDWNGTLLDDTHLSLQATNHILQHYDRGNIDLGRFQEIFDTPLVKFFSNLGFSEADIKTQASSLMELFHVGYYKNNDIPYLRQYAEKAPALSESRLCRNVILGNHLAPSIKDSLTRLNIAGSIDTILANKDVEEQVRKISKGERLRHYMETARLSPKDTIIIGDTPEKALIGREFGIASILITGGYASEARLQAVKPDYLIHSLHELGPILQKGGFTL